MALDEQLPAEAAARAATISNVRSDLSVDVTGAATQATFRETAVLRFDSSASTSYIDFSPARVLSMTLNGRPVPMSAVHDGRIHLDGLQDHNELRIESEVPYLSSGVGMHRQIDAATGKVFLYTNCEPFNAHRWHPCFDQPDLKTRVTLHVDAAAGDTVVANNPVAQRSVSGDGSIQHVDFVETPPISTYLVAMSAGPMRVYGHTTASGIECSVMVRESMAPYFDEKFFFDVTEKGLEYYTQLFGRPYPFAKFDQVLVPEFNSGAMENPGCITYNDQLCVFFSKPTLDDYSRVAGVILHEMAHMWFGDLVTLKGWEDLWLNESFAELMEKFASAHVLPQVPTWAEFAMGRKAWGLRADQQPSTHPVAGLPGPVSRARDNFDGITYSKGCAVVRQLIEFVTPDSFFAGVRRYFQRFAWGNASLSDFLGELERSSGRSLQQWSQEWLRTTGMSQLGVDADVAPDGRYRRVEVVQSPGSGDAVMRSHVLTLGCYERDATTGRLVRTDSIPVRIASGQDRVVIPQLAGRRRPDLLLVNDGDLTYAKIRLDPHSMQTVLASLGSIDDVLARSVCWGMLYDCARDAQLSASDFVAAACRHLPAETTTTVLTNAIDMTEGVIAAYADPAHRRDLERRLAATAGAQMHRAAPGSDAQLLWARCYIANAVEPADLAQLQGLLDGSVSVTGLAVDTGLRWDLVTALSRAGRLGEAAIAAEERRDPTDVGHRRALTARALQPTAAAKAWAWAQLTSDALSLQERKAVGQVFGMSGQERLLRPYVARLEAFLPQLWQGPLPELARMLTTVTFPTGLGSPAAAAMADRLLAQPLPQPALRIIRDARATIERNRKGRAVDAAGWKSRGTAPQGLVA